MRSVVKGVRSGATDTTRPGSRQIGLVGRITTSRDCPRFIAPENITKRNVKETCWVREGWR